MMRILLDTNIVLDVLLNRQPFVNESRRIWEAADQGAFDACIAGFTIPTIHYVCRKHAGPAAADHAVDSCLDAFEIAALYRECLVAARQFPGDDFEDNLQVASAVADFIQGIVTRNPKDFIGSPIRIYAPAELLGITAPLMPPTRPPE
jgi:predicted nucleic acid-binding protein